MPTTKPPVVAALRPTVEACAWWFAPAETLLRRQRPTTGPGTPGDGIEAGGEWRVRSSGKASGSARALTVLLVALQAGVGARKSTDTGFWWIAPPQPGPFSGVRMAPGGGDRLPQVQAPAAGAAAGGAGAGVWPSGGHFSRG
ncbi:hypothetical protein GCM10007147_26040 [Nocardiopsis kunsanensis]|uniref:Uncharacterized protein n=1 Tax=Nocardiopsis kunsanensis TaxID=141693 RepID=A0A919CIY5_9ACTN|nr:hypothetical protein GCM10007147_26040 [Nocardiopsis kunsanensis]